MAGEAANEDLAAGAGGGLDGIAIVGMSVRLPGAPDLDTYWRNLREGVESIRFFTDAELAAAGVEPAQLKDPNYVKARGALADVELFDADLFGFTPREAETMDPQHRLFLEEAWKALEHAGWNAETYPGAISVFAGSNLTGYLIRNLAPNEELVKRVGPLQVRIRNDKDFLATLVAYKLNLRGPAINVQTACSSSLVGVSLACQSLLSYQCDMALAGGVSVTVPSVSGYLFQEGVYAPDGHCRAFDAAARGTVLGDGVAVVVLKRLEDALADGDTVHAVIRGFAINNDGALKLDYTAPSVDGQAEVIGMAQSLGEIDPETVTYVEAHGTGTPLGDPIEIAALTQAFRSGTDARGFCAIGSAKTNIGHLDAAAGTAGLVKTVLALTHRELPPTLHFMTPNPQLDLESSPFWVVRELTPWQVPAGQPRRAGVSSFGVGGTNAHVVVEEAPAPAAAAPSRPWQLLLLSARHEDSLATAAETLAAHLSAHPELPLADVAHTLARGRKGFPFRQAVVCESPDDAVAVLRGGAPRRVATGLAETKRRRGAAFLFAGIGDHYVGMGRELYEREAVFRAAVDRSAAILRPLLGLDVREVLYPPVATDAPTGSAGPDLARMLGRKAAAADPRSERLDGTALLHPTLFVVEHALAELWLSWGVRPEAMIGYSIGEYVAATLAGVLSLEDALRLVAERARIIDRQPPGGMLAISLPEPEVLALLADPRCADLSLAAVNGPAFCVVAGAGDDLDRLAAELERKEVVHRRLKARHPFHSRRLEGLIGEFRALLAGVALAPPQIPFLSNVTGTWIAAEEATDPAYWAEHLCRTVRFGDDVAELLSPSAGMQRDWALIEIGPGQTLGSIALQTAGDGDRAVAVPSLPHEYDPQAGQAFLLHSLGRLWAAGLPVDWKAFYSGEERRRVPLPGTPFERRRYWIDPVARQAAEPVASLDKKADTGEWLYRPTWRERPRRALAGAPPPSLDGPWLLLADESGVAEKLAATLASQGQRVAVAAVGPGFTARGPAGDVERFTVVPGSPADFEQLLAALGEAPRRIVHLWSLPAAAADVEDRAFYSLVFLAQAWGNAVGLAQPEARLTIVGSGACEVGGEGGLEPEKALVAGPCRVIPQEIPGLRCHWLDLPAPPATDDAAWAERWARNLLAELAGAGDDSSAPVALRGRRRFVREEERVTLERFDPASSRLRQGGVYVVLGGLGGIGLTFAGFLAERCAARLVLVGRHAPSAATEVQIRDFERLGSEVLVLQGDVTSRPEMEAVRAAALDRFGAIHGVIHAAGQPPGGLIQLKSREVAAAVLAPKVRGTRILDEVFGAVPGLDFLQLCSSLTALTGAVGLVDHAAANAFLDAYAQAGAARAEAGEGPHILSVNWDSWLEVGQAAAAGVAARLGSLLAEPGARFPEWQPAGEGGETSFESHLPASHWLVAEHRLRGTGLVPGTAYLEMARRAVAEVGGPGAVRLRNVVFSQPCLVTPGSGRVLRVHLAPDGDEWTVTIDSRSADAPGVDAPGGDAHAGAWQVHARAQASLTEAGARSHDFATAAARGTLREIGQDDDPAMAAIDFGPRWREALRELRLGDGEGWARVELAATHQGDLDSLALHPALTDVATGIARVLGRGAYLPLSYDVVTVLGPLPAQVQSHFRLREGGEDAAVLLCDVTVGDDSGRVLLEVAGYALRRLDEAALNAVSGATAPEAVAQASRATAGKDWSLGITPAEGAEIFGRLSDRACDEPQILVSVRDLAAVRATMAGLTGARAAEHMALLGGGGERHGRGASHAPYVAPRSGLEATLIGLYQDMLGVDQVGVHDNFFDLGGNSLVATQLISRVRETFAVEIALRSLFEAPTVAELGVVIVREQAAGVGEDELAAALAELKSLSPEELRRRLEEEEAFSETALAEAPNG